MLEPVPVIVACETEVIQVKSVRLEGLNNG